MGSSPPSPPSLRLTLRNPQTDLLRLSRINFSEIFQVLVHLKIVRAYIESVLRYGLPANYFGTILKVRPLSPFSQHSLTPFHSTARTQASDQARVGAHGALQDRFSRVEEDQSGEGD